MTPAELELAAAVYSDRELARDRAEWDRAAWLASQIINISGKTARRTVRPKDLIRFAETAEEKPSRPADDIAELRKRAIAIAEYHKSKFWTAINDKSLEKLKSTGT